MHLKVRGWKLKPSELYNGEALSGLMGSCCRRYFYQIFSLEQWHAKRLACLVIKHCCSGIPQVPSGSDTAEVWQAGGR